MNDMRNERWSAQKRLKILMYAEAKGNVRQTCKRFGISPMTFYSWRRKYGREGVPGLENKSSAPKKHHRKITVEVENEIIAFVEEKGFPSLRFECDLLKSERRIDICPTTLSRILRRNNVDYIALGKEEQGRDFYKAFRKSL
jgi:transposase-like protein